MPLDPARPLATRTVIQAVKNGDTLVIFQEGASRQLVDHEQVGRDHQIGGASGSGVRLEGGPRGVLPPGDEHHALAAARGGLGDDS